MAESNVGKFDGIYKLLSQHNFKLDRNVPDKLKCGKCNNILINPCEGPCLCKYCRKCIDHMLTNGIDKCTGDKVECKDGKLSNFLSNYSMNSKIAKLVLKCPEQMCLHKCELMKMAEHLRLCSINDAKCPFSCLGCSNDRLIADEMVDHLQSNSYNHNVILIETIENLRNDLNLFKGNYQKNTDEIEFWKENSKEKDQTISIMQDEIRSIKEKNQQMGTEINNLKIEADNKIAQLKEEIKKECRDNSWKETSKIAKRLDELETWLGRQMDESFSWKIEPLAAKINKFACNYSGIFYPRITPYKMQLAMQNKHGSDGVYIWLYIYYSERDLTLKWPFQGYVTIQISNKSKPNATKTITNYCNISQPVVNSYNYSEPFKFSYKELSNAGLMQNNNFTIDCCIK